MAGIWKILKSIVKFIQGLGTITIGFLVILVIAVALMGRKAEPKPSVPDGAVLVLWPNGAIVEQAQYPDPLESLFSKYRSTPPQTSVHDILRALKRAKDDKHIRALALITDSMSGAAQAHLHEIAAAIRDFKTSGKKVYALSTAYSQGGYLLAAQADKVYMNPAGSVLLTGFGSYPLYFKSFLDKIEANVHIFRVGTYKSAVEPFMRDDMSPAAKEANTAFLGALWSQYQASIVKARGLEPDALDKDVANMPSKMREAEGNFAELAVQNKLVDQLAPRATWRKALMAEYGADKSGLSFKQIRVEQYLAATDKPKKAGHDIAVITAQGEIVGGSGPISVTAAETVVGYIRNARHNPKTAAIVLRVDSPGGSVVASELIRQELAAAQAQGIPVIASMGPVAASGGYWICSTADQIWAEPSTITGSIGIFGMIPTFEKTLDKIGVHSDGVGTSPLADGYNITRAMNDETKDIIQQSIESGYREFLTHVAKGRKMSLKDVDKIAQGRVWIGTKAAELGLVDHLGGFDKAVEAAAEAAKVGKDYRVVFYRDKPNTLKQMVAQLFGSTIETDAPRTYGYSTSTSLSPVLNAAMKLKKEARMLANFNDPLGEYALCLTCEVR
ncbi:signal peptide peptidase SppA [Kordiimonas marina]|uniref:signal peptide peptidase SppA n=1 Tax=Kordiimonas marina TaxID=2872312 RepID=UPI001FF18B7F|nr:signal peptide peptidase SppA [Kordiimonas marina]MCJ9427562.1 signal peptide peptidase SppA [Kordiimonas marina]